MKKVEHSVALNAVNDVPPPLLQIKKIGQFVGARPCVTMMIFILQFLTMEKFKRIFGIDVCKESLDIYDTASGQYFQIPNTAKSILKWTQQLDQQTDLCVFEPTGSYSDRLLHLLCQRSISINLVNPLKSQGFANAQGIISKNDKQASKTLALMGQCLNLPLYKKPEDHMYKRRQLLSGIAALKKQRQMLSNQLHALSYQVLFAPAVEVALKETLQVVEQNIESLEKELNDLSEEDYDKQLKLLTTVVGIGNKTAHLLICATGGLEYFQRARQLSKFIGVVPSTHTSGSSIRIKGRITKKGNGSLRATLYMAARSAKRYNLACKELYERLRLKGKSHKQAMVAIMNKLIKQVFGVFSSGIPFENQFYLKFQNS